VEVPRSISTGTRVKDLIIRTETLPFTTSSTGNVFFIPIFNLFKIDQGAGAD
jgi:hypothetical protein